MSPPCRGPRPLLGLSFLLLGLVTKPELSSPWDGGPWGPSVPPWATQPVWTSPRE